MKLWTYYRGGERMRAVRSFFGLSINRASERSGISQSDLTAYERQESEPEVETLEKFCDLFGMAIEDLFYVELEESERRDFDADQGEPEY
jgi:transcriptional regulator with XRE-family HTH domain